MTNVRDLLNKYLSGETTREEERRLRNYFRQEDIPQDLREIAPIFTYLEDEATALAILDEVRRAEKETIPSGARHSRHMIWAVAALAASLFIGIVVLPHRPHSANRHAENHVWINGKKITHPETVRHYAEKSFGKVKTEENILEEQLSFMFE